MATFSNGLATSQFVKYRREMVLVTRRHLERAAARYKDAAKELRAWTAVVDKVRWHNFGEVRGTFPDADAALGFVIFNIRHNRYRLITHLHYAKDDPKKGSTRGHCYIRSFLTHAEYNNPPNWDKEFGP